MSNVEVREAIKRSGLRHWQVADMIGVADTTFCRMLRRELPENKKQEILTVIQRAEKDIAMNDGTFEGVYHG